MNHGTLRMSIIPLAAFTVQLMSPLSSSAVTLKGSVSTPAVGTPNYLQMILHQDTIQKSQIFNDKGHFDGQFSALLDSALSIANQANADSHSNSLNGFGSQLSQYQYNQLCSELSSLLTRTDAFNSMPEGAPRVQAGITHLQYEVANDTGELTANQASSLLSQISAVQTALTGDEVNGKITVPEAIQLMGELKPIQASLNGDTSTVAYSSSVPGRLSFLESQIVDDTGHLFGQAGVLTTDALNINTQFARDTFAGAQLTPAERAQLVNEETSLQNQIDRWAGIGPWGIAHPVAAPVMWKINAESTQVANDAGRLGGNYNTLSADIQQVKSEEQSDASSDGDNGDITAAQSAALMSQLNGIETQINYDNSTVH